MVSPHREEVMRKAGKFLAGVSAIIFLTGSAVPAQASEMDILLKKLVEKKILTEQEAREVRSEVQQEVTKEQAASGEPLQAAETKQEKEQLKAAVKDALPAWVKNTTWAGDFRLRHESQFRDPAKPRNRERMRARFGFTTKPWNELEVGVRLGTGASGDPVAPNQSFTNTFDKKAVFIDKAYAKYSPAPWVVLSGGKIENPFYTNTELVWDADVTPEGAVAQFKTPESLPLPMRETFPTKLFATVGAFPISELSNDNGDPAVFGFQVGKEVGLPHGFSWTESIAYYDLTAIKTKRTSDINQVSAPSGNSTDGPAAAPVYRDDFNILDVQGRLGVPPVFGQPVVVLGNYVLNTVASDDDTAWQAGLKVGKVTEKLGSWEAAYYYKRVESDALFGAITDSDFGGGGTNHKGHKLGLRVGLNKYAEAGVSYSRTDEIDGTQNKLNTLQVDASVKY